MSKPLSFNNTNADIMAIVELLEKVQQGEVVTYLQIQEVCIKTKDIRKNRSALQRALRKLANGGIIFYNILNVGYKRATDSDIVNHQPSRTKRIRKIASRSIKELETVNFKALTPEEKQKKVIYESLAGITLFTTKPKSIGLLNQKAIINKNISFDPAETLKLLAS